jgi:serine phosphatase RsbU (regulator of sigma subunit)
LIVPENLRTGAEHLPASPEPLRQRLPTAHELTILTREDHSASGFPVLDGADPELAAWWEAGARLLVPLRAPAPEDRSKPGDTQNEPIGVWVLGTPRSGDLPEREDLEAIGRVGRQAAVLLDYARLNYEQIHQALINQDIKRALEVQQRLLPLAHPGWPGRLEFAARLQAARETSGDFYDVVDWTLAGGADAGPYPPLQIAVGDVRGKGMGAAVVMALAMSALRAGAELSPNRDRAFASPAATLALVSRQLHRSLGIRDFVCCALAVVEPMEDDRVRLRLANAGQVPPLLCRAGTVRELIPDGDALPLGVLSDPDYREMVVELQPDDVMIFASDGIVEAPCSEDGLGATTGLAFTNKVAGGTATLQRPKTGDQMFGFGRLARIASDCAAHYPSAEEVANNIWAAVSAWCGGQFPHDDVTLVVLRVPATADARGNASAEIGRLHPVEMPGT